MLIPTAEATQWVEATTPKVPRISGLVVKAGIDPILVSLQHLRVDDLACRGKCRLSLGMVENAAQTVTEQIERQHEAEDR
jgi:hypothetical protein